MFAPVRTVHLVRRFQKNELFALFAVRTVRYLRKKLLFGANSANKRTANTFVRSSVVPGYRSDLDLIQEGLISRDSFKR